MTADPATSSDAPPFVQPAFVQEVIPKKAFSRIVLAIFVWIIVGICVIYGIRLWFNSNISAAFLPIIGATFCAAIAFTLVLALSYVTGPITLKVGGAEFEGASGPIILWCLCFFIIAFGLYLLGLADAVKSTIVADPRPVHRLIFP